MTLVEVMVALFITGLTVGGVITGYRFCMVSTVKDSLYAAANARVLARMEQVRSAKWDTAYYALVDQLTSSNFPDEIVPLDLYAQSSNTNLATITTQITPISTSPPLRRIHVDCIWSLNGVQMITNSIETCRAPDQ
jgi:hypothetical protein